RHRLLAEHGHSCAHGGRTDLEVRLRDGHVEEKVGVDFGERLIHSSETRRVPLAFADRRVGRTLHDVDDSADPEIRTPFDGVEPSSAHTAGSDDDDVTDPIAAHSGVPSHSRGVSKSFSRCMAMRGATRARDWCAHRTALASTLCMFGSWYTG